MKSVLIAFAVFGAVVLCIWTFAAFRRAKNQVNTEKMICQLGEEIKSVFPYKYYTMVDRVTGLAVNLLNNDKTTRMQAVDVSRTYSPRAAAEMVYSYALAGLIGGCQDARGAVSSVEMVTLLQIVIEYDNNIEHALSMPPHLIHTLMFSIENIMSPYWKEIYKGMRK